jgi:Domain of Unknown Function (DUF1080)/FG-GAP-like repeat
MMIKPVLLPALLLLFTVQTLSGADYTLYPDAGPSFHPDATFTGSTLKGWHPWGQTTWQAQNSELIGKPQQPGGGWLVLDRSYQDVGLYTEFRCTGGCKTGVLFHAEKTPDGGMKGIYFSLTDPDVNPYAVTIDAQGTIVQRDKLPEVGNQMRIAPPPNPNPRPATPHHFPGWGGGAVVKLPFDAPDTSLRPNDWNGIEFFFDANIVRAFLNNGLESAGSELTSIGYGPIALYVGGTGEVRFRNVAYKDLMLKERVAEKTGSDFRKQQLNDFYYSWGADAADFNHDGIMDVVSGPYIYYGPDYTKSREIYLASTSNVSTEYASEAWMEYAADFTGDGWPDVITCLFGGPTAGIYLYVNPRGEPRRWDKYRVVTSFANEISEVADVDGDGKPEVVYSADGYVRYAKPDPANPTGPWVIHNVSEKGYAAQHGVGVGDVNGDGRQDILNPYGWWEQPPAGSQQESWTYHPEVFGRWGRGLMGASIMGVYDVNGDGLNDVVTVLNPHGWGLAWFEQKRDSAGKISFVRHMVMDDLWTKNSGDVVFSEPHGTGVADVDGDGKLDFIVGKRYWAHRDDYLDPDPYGPAVLYWYKAVLNPKAPGGAELVPHLINSRSGAGSNVSAADLNHDGATDIITATRYGTFIFWGTPVKGKKP